MKQRLPQPVAALPSATRRRCAGTRRVAGDFGRLRARALTCPTPLASPKWMRTFAGCAVGRVSEAQPAAVPTAGDSHSYFYVAEPKLRRKTGGCPLYLFVYLFEPKLRRKTGGCPLYLLGRAQTNYVGKLVAVPYIRYVPYISLHDVPPFFVLSTTVNSVRITVYDSALVAAISYRKDRGAATVHSLY